MWVICRAGKLTEITVIYWVKLAPQQIIKHETQRFYPSM